MFDKVEPLEGVKRCDNISSVTNTSKTFISCRDCVRSKEIDFLTKVFSCSALECVSEYLGRINLLCLRVRIAAVTEKPFQDLGSFAAIHIVRNKFVFPANQGSIFHIGRLLFSQHGHVDVQKVLLRLNEFCVGLFFFVGSYLVCFGCKDHGQDGIENVLLHFDCIVDVDELAKQCRAVFFVSIRLRIVYGIVKQYRPCHGDIPLRSEGERRKDTSNDNVQKLEHFPQMHSGVVMSPCFVVFFVDRSKPPIGGFRLALPGSTPDQFIPTLFHMFSKVCTAWSMFRTMAGIEALVFSHLDSFGQGSFQGYLVWFFLF
mmetsp:Transcript_25234/g.59504  ORF Transcript_25234/g.59504 Transcript_25234/m.59504 type:complete len:315 (-) Transcript_25234:296-1240(-)